LNGKTNSVSVEKWRTAEVRLGAVVLLARRQAKVVWLFQQRYFAGCGSRVVTTLAQVWGRAAPGVLASLF